MWRITLLLITLALPAASQTCGRPICSADPVNLSLTSIISFEGLTGGNGPGRPVTGLLSLDGAQFGERFQGITIIAVNNYDHVPDLPNVRATAPLTLLPGADRFNLSILRLPDTVLLSGDGPAGFPRQDATGEGAIAVLFDIDQRALAFDLRGGEGGFATVAFFRRDGSLIDIHHPGPLAEASYGFVRTGQNTDIAGFLILNDDPEGIAFDNLRFDPPTRTSALPQDGRTTG